VRKDGTVSTRTLVILRHAKAANPETVPDRDRPLTERGHADAAAAGAWLAQRGYQPDVVVCSPARRTKETWHGAALALAAAPTVRYDDGIYHATAESLLDVVHGLPDDVGTALLIGHNPALSQLSALLDPDAADPNGLRTAGIAVHTIDGAWVEYGPEQAPIAATHTARDEE
jgi:phosphohistidine phosphatase